LKIDLVEMPLRDFRRIARWNHFNHVCAHHTLGRTGDSKVAILRVASQALFERIRPMMNGNEGVLSPGLLGQVGLRPRSGSRRSIGSSRSFAGRSAVAFTRACF
jgi:hypothetical protein